MSSLYHESSILTEEQKNTDEYLMETIDQAISELVIEKTHLQKAYNYYNGKRDPEQFKFLEDNFSIGNATSVEFFPLIRRHIDALVGEHLQNKLKPHITCKDTRTLKAIEEAKYKQIYNEEIDKLRSQFQANVNHATLPEEDRSNTPPPKDEAADELLKKMKDEMEKGFVSDFEIAAQSVLTHLIQSKSVDLYNKLKLLFIDILVAGECYYRVKTRRKGETPEIEVLNTFDVFKDQNRRSVYVKTSPRIVVRHHMYRDQILREYGSYFNTEDLELLQNVAPGFHPGDYVYTRSSNGIVTNAGNQSDDEIDNYNLIPVYEVEWLSTNPIEVEGETIYRMDRYKGVRVGETIYLNMGKDEEVIRSVEDPYNCYNSINGVHYSDRNGKPYSLALATANLQDEYDILHFQRNTLIANSGVRGDFLDVSSLPTFLGKTPAERIVKWKAYKKHGVALINTAQEGRGANHNTIYGGYDDTVSGQAIQAIQLVIQQTEDMCSAITGVFRERLGNIESRDAVSNIEQGLKTSAVITKQYFQVMDSITTELLIDSLNACKESYRDGMIGSIILGDKNQKIFSIQPENFSFTDYDIHIGDSGDIIRDIQKIEMITMELIKSGQTDIDIVLEGVGKESLTDMKSSLIGAVKAKKREMDQIGQLQQAMEQAQQQLKEVQGQAQKLQFENDQLKANKDKLEATRVSNDYDVRKEANENVRTFNEDKIELDKARIELEKLQLFDNNPLNNEIKNV